MSSNYVNFSYTSEVGKDHDLEIEFEETPYRPAVMYLSNGDPGYPEEGGDFDIYSIKKNGVELIDRLNSKIIDRIEEKLIDYLNIN